MNVSVRVKNPTAGAKLWQVGIALPDAPGDTLYLWGDYSRISRFSMSRTANIPHSQVGYLRFWLHDGKDIIDELVFHDVTFDPKLIHVADFASRELVLEKKPLIAPWLWAVAGIALLAMIAKRK